MMVVNQKLESNLAETRKICTFDPCATASANTIIPGATSVGLWPYSAVFNAASVNYSLFGNARNA